MFSWNQSKQWEGGVTIAQLLLRHFLFHKLFNTSLGIVLYCIALAEFSLVVQSIAKARHVKIYSVWILGFKALITNVIVIPTLSEYSEFDIFPKFPQTAILTPFQKGKP